MRYSTSSAFLALALFGASTLAQSDAAQSSLYNAALSLASDIVSIGGAAATASSIDAEAISSEVASVNSVEATLTAASDFPSDAVTSNPVVQTALLYLADASSIIAESGAAETSGAAASSVASQLSSAGASVTSAAASSAAASETGSDQGTTINVVNGSTVSGNYAAMATAGLSGVAGAALLGVAALL